MAGPNLTGWTATTITPVAKTIAPPALSPQQQAQKKEAKAAAAVRKAAAETAEAEAQASGNPAKMQQAWELLRRTAADEEGTGLAGATQEAQHKLAVAFKKRNPTFNFSASGPGGTTKNTIDQLIFEAPSGQVRSYVSQNLFKQTGLGTGTQLDTDVRRPAFGNTPVPAAGRPISNPAQAQAQSDVIGGLAPSYGAQVAGAAGGPSLSGPTSGWTPTPIPGEAPAASFSAPVAPNTMTGSRSSPTDKYNLTPSELGSAGPDPRAYSKPTTPLEQLLRTIYPDAPTSAADPLADPRNPGVASSGFADVLAYINSQSSSGSSGYVPAPQMLAPAGVPSAAGANIASTIPGAPSWLGPQINSLSGGGVGGFVQAPSGGGGINLSGLAAISAEQRVQQAQLDAVLAKQQADYIAQQNAARELAARKAQLERQRGSVVGSGWNQPIYKDGNFFAGELPY